MNRTSRSLAGLAISGLIALLLGATAFAATGGITQKAGTAGCISDTGYSGACTDGVALYGAASVTVSPGGTNAYAAAIDSDAVVVFDRDTTTGALTQKAGTAGCISNTGSGGCIDGVGLDGARSVAVSQDGKSVYVASFLTSSGSSVTGSIAIFDRDTTTGALTQKTGTAGCISGSPVGGCVDGYGLDSVWAVTLSPDGKNVYVASVDSDAVTIFDRDTTTGALTQKTGTAGCISETEDPGWCADGVALDAAKSVTVSPDGKNVYVGAGDAIAIFDRDTTTGALTQKTGTAGCISDTGSSGACTDGAVLGGATSVAISPSGKSAYVASYISDAIAIFDRNTTTGALTQKYGTAGCISDDGTGGGCVDGAALDAPMSVTVSPDGNSAYVASYISAAVAVFDRDTTTGALTQKTGTAGCVSETGTGGTCADGVAIGGSRSVAVSPDGGNVYAASELGSAVTVFDRDLPPETTITSGPTGLINDNTPTFGFSSGEGGSSFECRIDGGTFALCSGPAGTHTTAPLADGAHTFAVRAVDPQANPDPSPASRAFTVDATAPETTLTAKPKRKLKTKKKSIRVKVAFSAEAAASFECSLDGGTFEPCISPFEVKVKSKGGKGKKHEISVRATDAAGNVEAAPAKASFTVIKK